MTCCSSHLPRTKRTKKHRERNAQSRYMPIQMASRPPWKALSLIHIYQPGQLLFMLGSLARCGHAVVQHGLQGLPVLQGAAGQGVRVKAGILKDVYKRQQQ